MAEKKQTDLEKIQELVELMISKDLVEVEIINGESKIHLKRPQVNMTAAAAMPIEPAVNAISGLCGNATATKHTAAAVAISFGVLTCKRAPRQTNKTMPAAPVKAHLIEWIVAHSPCPPSGLCQLANTRSATNDAINRLFCQIGLA